MTAWRWPASLVLVLAGAAAGALVVALGHDLVDLLAYRHGGHAVLAGRSPYASDDPVTGLPFTYPPFAAVLMAPLAPIPAWLAAALWTGASMAALGGSVVVVRRTLGRTPSAGLVVTLSVTALALEPVWQNLAFGQVNLLLMLVVLVDLLRPERRLSGIGVGVVAGIKLTPLVFVVLLLLAGRPRVAARAAVAFAATIVVGLLAVPGASSYWTDRLLDPSRVGPPALAHNQSVHGALTRVLGGAPSTAVWVAVAGVVGLAVLVGAAVVWRRGDRVVATCVASMSMLLTSPVSWSHHWVWAVPVALVLWEQSRWLAAAWTAVFVARPILWPPWGEGRELAWGAAEHVVGNAYLLAALALATWAVARRPTGGRVRSPGSGRRGPHPVRRG